MTWIRIRIRICIKIKWIPSIIQHYMLSLMLSFSSKWILSSKQYILIIKNALNSLVAIKRQKNFTISEYSGVYIPDLNIVLFRYINIVVFRYLNIVLFRYLNIVLVRYLNIVMFIYLNIVFCLDTWILCCLDTSILWCLDIWILCCLDTLI